MFIEQSGGSTWKQERRLRLCSAENGDGAEPLPERLYQLVLVIGVRLDLGSERFLLSEESWTCGTSPAV